MQNALIFFIPPSSPLCRIYSTSNELAECKGVCNPRWLVPCVCVCFCLFDSLQGPHSFVWSCTHPHKGPLRHCLMVVLAFPFLLTGKNPKSCSCVWSQCETGLAPKAYGWIQGLERGQWLRLHSSVLVWKLTIATRSFSNGHSKPVTAVLQSQDYFLC